jgi:hypothetical protein
MMEKREVSLNCEEGRRLGCATFCCRLIVRLTPEERERGLPGIGPGMNCVPKNADGLCIHLDRETSLCRIWKERPRVCREYDCNHDELLTVVLESGFTSLARLVQDARRVRKTAGVRVPLRSRNRGMTG